MMTYHPMAHIYIMRVTLSMCIYFSTRGNCLDSLFSMWGGHSFGLYFLYFEDS